MFQWQRVSRDESSLRRAPMNRLGAPLWWQLACIAISIAALPGCFEDPNTEVVGEGDGQATEIGGEVSDDCGGAIGCPCQLDDECLSTYCAIPDDASSGTCSTPCGGPCPEGETCKSVGRDGKKKYVCQKDIVTPDCTPSDEICDGIDNNCDGETDEKLCDDSNECTIDECKPELATDLADGCTHTVTTLGCDDGDPCTAADVCTGGTCLGSKLDCADDNPCTDDACDESGACVHALNSAPCDDSSVCTKDDACGAGACLGTAIDCDDNNPCTGDICNATDGCSHFNNTEACDDGDPCTTPDTCQDGACAAGLSTVCDDGNPCTADACDPALAAADLSKGCTSTNISELCNDGNPCTSSDACIGGSCTGTVQKDCDDGNTCTIDACDKESGECTATPGKTGDGCDDNNPCTTNDACDASAVCIGDATNCDDGVGCTIDVCDVNLGTCYHENNSGFACEDGSLCTLGDACIGGACIGGKAKLCDDAQPCTDDSCNAKTGVCEFVANDHPCDDGNPCTQKDLCVKTVCTGSDPVVCNDGNECTLETCDSATGKCEIKNAADNVLCTDADSCSSGDACNKGVCTAGPKTYCNDDNVCTNDSCDPKTGKCAFTANTAGCDDGNKCTVDDVCAAGSCSSGKNTCECESTADCKNKEDGNFCNGVLVCNLQTNSCEVDDNSIVVCDPANNTPCTTFTCKAENGICTPDIKPNGSACEADDSACTVGDTCALGQCIAGKSLTCVDDNDCTDDACDPKTGCVFAPNTLPCFDGDQCTKGDVCKDGACKDGGTLKNCNDNDVCSADSCNPKTGNCVFAPLSGNDCDDGNACTSLDACSQGGCIGSKAKVCDDGNSCTLDACDTTNGKCTAQPAFEGLGCDDGKACTKGDTCKSGTCTAGPVPSCDDGNPCTKGSCVAATGACAQSATTKGTACSDGNACTLLDACDAGKCIALDTKLCDDNNVCTIDVCEKSTGLCAYQPTAEGFECNDGDLCSLGDSCSNGTCKAKAAVDCDDNNVCTVDSCDTKTGKCTHPPVPVSPLIICNDDNACTYDTTIYKLYNKIGDACWAGKCSGTAISCNDGNQCTVDSCDTKTGCKHTPLGNVGCNDGNACTVGDTCASGSCKGTGQVCNDGNQCTNDSCNPKTGCVFAPNSNSCNDGNTCTTNDKCGAGACKGGAPLDCQDGYECTDDPCDPAKGCQHVIDDTNPCSDAEPCTSGDACKGGVCKSAGPTDCDDKNVCTTDSCESGVGCKHAPNGDAGCDDNNACTTPDVCSGGKCTAAGQVNCNDNDVCTTDSCDPKKGCVHAAFTGPCDDGNACTKGDSCASGKCVAAGTTTCADASVCTIDTCDPATGCVFSPATGNSVATISVVSDVGTQVGTKLVGSEVPDAQPAQAVTAPPAAWAKISGALYMALPSCAVSTASVPQDVLIFREVNLPTAAKVNKATLTFAGAGDWSCAFGGKPVISGTSAGTSQSADVTSEIGAGASLLKCFLKANGQPTVAGKSAPCGFSFRLDVEVAINAVTCDDGSACTSLDICEGGACIGTNGLSCNDGNPCTTDACDPGNGCKYTNNDGAGCSDGDACTYPDFCAKGSCTSTTKTDCGDGNDCTTDSCDSAKGCGHVATDPGTAKGFEIVSGSNTQCATSAKVVNGDEVPVDLKPCVPTYDGFSEWVQIPGAKWIWSDAIVSDPKKDQSVWFLQTFDVPSGVQQLDGTLTIAADAAATCFVDDNLVGVVTAKDEPWKQIGKVNLGTYLSAGTHAVRCRVDNAGSPNGTILTNPAGLVFKINVTWFEPDAAKPCSDGNACTKDDGCIKGVCKPGPLLDCDDNNACTIDVCDSKAGCSHVADDKLPCNDGSVCTEQDACVKGSCVAAKKKSCDDGNVCTTDSCDAIQGCTTAPIAGNPGCDDGSICTVNSFCADSVCKAGDLKDCSDSKVCTDDGCDAKTGCKWSPTTDGKSCDDGDTCTAEDLCANGLCLGKLTAPCNDGNDCTKDACDPKQGCVHVAATGGVCNDGDACTLNDVCVIGECKAGSFKDCFDTEQCTADSCDPTTGKCEFTALSGDECDDGNLCTLNDLCANGTCKAGPPPPCGDGDPCTVDNCAPSTGKCQHDAASPGAACDDGNLCTQDTKCVSGKCIGLGKACDDSNSCTADSCDPATGKCAFAPTNDGGSCGSGGTCKKGICL